MLSSQGHDAAGYVQKLVGDHLLSDLVIYQGQVLNHIVRVVRCTAHRHHAGRLLTGYGLKHGVVDLHLHEARQELAEGGGAVGFVNIARLLHSL